MPETKPKYLVLLRQALQKIGREHLDDAPRRLRARAALEAVLDRDALGRPGGLHSRRILRRQRDSRISGRCADTE